MSLSFHKMASGRSHVIATTFLDDEFLSFGGDTRDEAVKALREALVHRMKERSMQRIEIDVP